MDRFEKLYQELLDWCKEHSVKVIQVPHEKIRDYGGMNTEAAKTMNYPMEPGTDVEIDESSPFKVKTKNLYHELVERHLMHDDDMKYWQAHLKSLDAEEEIVKDQGPEIRIQPDDEEDAELLKARGVPAEPGPPPGPPPRFGLEWNGNTHRWIRKPTSTTSDIQDPGRIILYHYTRDVNNVLKNGISGAKVFASTNLDKALASAKYHDDLDKKSGKEPGPIGSLFVMEISVPRKDVTIHSNGDITVNRTVKTDEFRKMYDYRRDEQRNFKDDIPDFDPKGKYPIYHFTTYLWLDAILKHGIGKVNDYEPTKGVRSLDPEGYSSWTRDPKYSIRGADKEVVRITLKDRLKYHPRPVVAMLAPHSGDYSPEEMIPAYYEHEEAISGIVSPEDIERIDIAKSVWEEWQTSLEAYKKWQEKYKEKERGGGSYTESIKQLEALMKNPLIHIGLSVHGDKGTVIDLADDIQKARGVAAKPGPAPGPAPRPKLMWNYQSHRWVLPEEAVEAPKNSVKHRINVDELAGWDEAKDVLEHDYQDENGAVQKLEDLKAYLQEYADLAVLGNDYPPEKLKGLFRNTLSRVKTAASQSRARAKEFKEELSEEEAHEMVPLERAAARKLSEMKAKYPNRESIMDATPFEMTVFIDKFVHMIHTQADADMDRDTVLSTAFGFSYNEDELIDAVTQEVLDKLAGVFKAVVTEIRKARGVPVQPGPPPGPAPRYGLEWDSVSHRWVRVKVDGKVVRPIKWDDVPTLDKLAPESTNELIAHLNDLPKHGRKFDHLLGFLESYARIADEGKECPEEVIDHAWDQIKNTFSIFQGDLPKDTPYQWAVDVKRDPSRLNKIVAIDHIAHLMHDRGSILPHMLGEEEDWFAPEFHELDEDVKHILEDISKSSDQTFMLDIQKAQGVPVQPGPPPGPPPRIGLEWDHNIHRWIRPSKNVDDLEKDSLVPGNVVIYHATRKVGAIDDEGITPHEAGVIRHEGVKKVYAAESFERALQAERYEDRLKTEHKDERAPSKRSGDIFVYKVSVPAKDILRKPNGDITLLRTIRPSEFRQLIHESGKVYQDYAEKDDNSTTVHKSEDDQFSNIEDIDGRKYVNLGNTFRTDIDVPVGTILEVNVQELTITNGRLTWAKPRVSGVDTRRTLPYTASMALNIAKKYEGVLQKADRTASQEDLQEFDEGGREKFDVKTGDEGTLSIDEHITFLDEEAASEFKGVRSYQAWKAAKKRLESHSGSLHNDIRIKFDDSDFLRGFTATVGNVHNRNKVLDHQDGDKLLVASFKAHTPHGKTKWQTDVGMTEAWLFEPGEIGSPGKRWSAIYKVERKARVKVGRIDDHFIELKVTGTKLMPEGRWVLMFAPINPGSRSWILMYPKKQEFDEPTLNSKPVKKGSLLKTVLENRG